MSFHDMTLRDKEQVPFTSCGSAIKSNQAIRDEMDRQIAEFKRKGGKIHDLTPTKDTLEQPAYESDLQRTMKEKKRKRAQNAVASKQFVQCPVSFMDGKNRAGQRASSGHQNISTKKLADGSLSHNVVVGATRVGTFKCIKEAIKARDEFRKKTGLEPAIY